MSATPNLPEEIITDILTRLPAKSIAQFRCVSKPWLSILTNPNFIKTHLHHRKEEKLMLISKSNSLHTLTLTLENDIISRKLTFPSQLDDKWVQIVGSCNGLVLAVNGYGSSEACFLINPTTLSHSQLSNSPLALDPRASFRMYGFGYDDFSDDYKVVTLSYYNTDNEYEPDVTDTFVDVFNLRSRAWRRVGSSPYDHAVPHLASGVFVNGALHWLASKTTDYSSVIAAFDLGNDEFGEIPAPNVFDKDKFVFNELAVLGGCLCIIVDQGGNGINIWMMREYGVEESWIKLDSVHESDYFDKLKPLCFVGDSEVVLEVDEEKLIVYSLREGRSRDMLVDGAEAMFRNGWTFVESLVLPSLN